MRIQLPINSTFVWTNTTRTLTGFGGAITVNQNNSFSLAAATVQDLRFSSNGFSIVTAGSYDAAGHKVLPGQYDGTNFRAYQPALSAVGSIAGVMCGGSSVGPALDNTDAVSHNCAFCAIQFGQ